jgi:predicted metalloprotease with PDZ domain
MSSSIWPARVRSVVSVDVWGRAIVALVVAGSVPSLHAEAPIEYALSFAEPEQRWMQVEVLFADLGSAPLEVRMSRSSPGRYALHEFAKNVYQVSAVDRRGQALPVTQSDGHGWRIAGHDGSVSFRYRVYGDRVDGTYLGIDSTHAHINAPAAFVWARGLEGREAVVRFEMPEGLAWRVATQLFPTEDPLEYRAPNLQYLMDSPIELSDFGWTVFSLPVREGERALAEFRIALHHEGDARELEELAESVESIAREQRAIFGELPDFDRGTYTFIADYLPWANGDGMEHRNSAVLTSARSLALDEDRDELLGTLSHELFHAWNVERIRPASLEPFDFERANPSGELWLAEGFTSYYGVLVLQRAGLATLEQTREHFVGWIEAVQRSPGRESRSPEQMSRLAPFVDAASSIDGTNWGNTFISYYTWGAAIALGLDLTLRQETKGESSLDDYLRALWSDFGRAPSPSGFVGHPYTSQDAERVLARLVGDEAFASDFFARFVRGRELPDYTRLLASAGLVLRPAAGDEPWFGEVSFAFEGGSVRVSAPVPQGSPAHRGGLAQGDRLLTFDDAGMESAPQLEAALRRRRPGETAELSVLRRGRTVKVQIELAKNPVLELVTSEGGGTLAEEARAFRDAWLGSRGACPCERP